jgi:hypothetical protein
VGEAIKNKVFAYPATYAKGAENAGKTITQQIKDLKRGKKVEDTPITQMADGRFRYRIGAESKYADTQQEAQLAIDKDIFDKSGKKSELKNGIYYYRNKNGKPDSMPESEYTFKLRNQNLEKAKDAKDYKTWLKLANEKLADIEKQWQEADPLTKSELENDYLDLLRKMKKYQSYGGRFTKGKKSGGSKRIKKPKTISLSLKKSTYGMRPTLRKFTAPKISLKTISGGNYGGNYGGNTVRPRAIR